MTAGTAQKVALNLLSTQLMTALGRVYDGFMIHMVPSNAKLVHRGERMVQAIAGCTEALAVDTYARAGRSIPLAVLMLHGLPLEDARQWLDTARGDLRRALAGMGSAP